MNSIFAVFVALSGGALAAWYLYFYKKPGPKKVLAFLRLIWMGMLIYAVLAPYSISLVEKKGPLHWNVLVDSSASVDANLEPFLDDLKKFALREEVDLNFYDYSESAIPSSQPWVYLGDGNIETPMEAKEPIGAVLVPSIPEIQPNLIKAVSVPKELAEGTLFTSEAVVSEGVEVTMTWMGVASKGRKIRLKAPDKVGDYYLEVAAKKGTQVDRLSVPLKVVEFSGALALFKDIDHPHEGMLRRYASERNLKVLTVKKTAQIGQLDSNIPVVIIRKKELDPKTRELLENRVVLELSAKDPRAFEVLTEISPSGFMNGWGAPEKCKVKKYPKSPGISVHNHWISATNVHWFASSLVDPNSLSFFDALMDGMYEWIQPSELTINGLDRVYSKMNASYILSVAGTNGPLEATSMKFEIYRDGVRKDQPILREVEGPAFIGETTFEEAGVYELKVEAILNGEPISKITQINVEEGDPELLQPFNSSLWSHWKEKMLFYSLTKEEFNEDLASLTVQHPTFEVAQKNPQHRSVWYWGLLLLCAFAEWSLRRREGLV
jgi:hypothetical protein